LRVAIFPEERQDNPYLNQIKAGLRQAGVDIAPGNSDYLSSGWLWANRRKVQVLHLQWLQYHYVRGDRQAAWSLVIKFALKLTLARLLGYHIVWTMHNLFPHERSKPAIADMLVRRMVVWLAQAVIVHCGAAQQQLAARLGRVKGVFIAPHPNFCAVLEGDGAPESQSQARQALGWPVEQLVFLFFGAIRPYKGLQELITAFRQVGPGLRLRSDCLAPDSGELMAGADSLRLRSDCLPGNPNNLNANTGNYAGPAKLMIVGKPRNEDEAAAVRAWVGEDSNIQAVLERISDQDLARRLRGCDAVVLPFRDILTSGSAMLAISEGKPVIAPACGCLPELLGEDCAVLYPPEDPTGLVEALKRCAQLDLRQMGINARRRAEAISLEATIEPTLEAYGNRQPALATKLSSG
jgi:glycosyltransferase involved in cell wall biosynthesis